MIELKFSNLFHKTIGIFHFYLGCQKQPSLLKTYQLKKHAFNSALVLIKAGFVFFHDNVSFKQTELVYHYDLNSSKILSKTNVVFWKTKFLLQDCHQFSETILSIIVCSHLSVHNKILHLTARLLKNLLNIKDIDNIDT